MNRSSLLKKNRKRILFLASAIALLAGLVWWLYPEYGNSYSEQQRRLWNQYLDTCEAVVIDPSWYKEDEASKDTHAKLGSILERIDQLNLTETVPAMPVTLPEKLAEGIHPEKNLSELRHPALSGDGNAALKLFYHNLESRSPYYHKRGEQFGESRTVPSFRQITEQKKWIIQAIENKRPGSEFLLDLLYNEWLKNYDWKTTSMADAINKGDLTNDAHYQEFLSGIRSGDFLLFRYSAGACPGVRTGSVFQEMRKSLRQKAKSGSKEDWRRMMELMMSRNIIITQSEIFREFGQPYAWMQKLGLPQWVPFQKKYRSQTLSDFRDALFWCKKAADAGDLEAQYLWLQHSLPALRHLKRSTLNDILQFHRNLVEKGYRPYLKEFYNILKAGDPTKKMSSGKKDSLRDAFQSSWYAISHKIILSHLPAEETKQLSIRIKKLLSPATRQSAQSQSDDHEMEWKEDPDRFLSNLPNFLAHSNPRVRELASKYADQLVKENDLPAILTYAALYQQGKSIPQNKTRALALARKALEITEKQSPYLFLDGSFYNHLEKDHVGIDYAARTLFIQFNMDRTTPGARPEEAFRLATQMLAAEQSPRFEDRPGFILQTEGESKDRICYYLGYMNEHGIGTPKDVKQAAAFYKNGSESTTYSPPDPFCRINLARLYEEGKGIEQSDEKALEYTRRAQKSDWRLTDEQKKEINTRIERLEEKRAQKKNK